MKSTSIPSLRVSPEVRKQAEAVLARGETLSAFVLEAVQKNIELRKTQQAFVARGLLSAERARKSGEYVSASQVIAKLARKLEKAKRRAA